MSKECGYLISRHNDGVDDLAASAKCIEQLEDEITRLRDSEAFFANKVGDLELALAGLTQTNELHKAQLDKLFGS